MNFFPDYKTIESMVNKSLKKIKLLKNFSMLLRFEIQQSFTSLRIRRLVLPLSEGLDFVALSRLKKRLPGCKLDPDEGDSSFNLNCPSFVTFCWQRKKTTDITT